MRSVYTILIVAKTIQHAKIKAMELAFSYGLFLRSRRNNISLNRRVVRLEPSALTRLIHWLTRSPLPVVDIRWTSVEHFKSPGYSAMIFNQVWFDSVEDREAEIRAAEMTAIKAHWNTHSEPLRHHIPK